MAVPSTVTLSEFNRLNVTCHVDYDSGNEDSSPSVWWTRLSHPSFHINGTQLVIHEVVHDDAGEYTCHAVLSENDDDQKSATVHVNVERR